MHCANRSSLFELAVGGAAPEPPAPDGAEVAVALEPLDEPPQPASSRSAATIAMAAHLAPLGRRVPAGTAFGALARVVRIISKSFAPSIALVLIPRLLL
jgi:hypothetical protein